MGDNKKSLDREYRGYFQCFIHNQGSFYTGETLKGLVPAGKGPQCGYASQKTPKTDDYYVQDLYLADVEEGGSHKVCCRRERQELMNMRVPLG